MGSILNETDRAAICSRLGSLSASSTARWGRMSVTGMLQHLRLSARMAVGDLEVAPKNKRALQVFPLKHLILYVLPFPKGAPTAPELLPDAAESLRGRTRGVTGFAGPDRNGPARGAGPAHPLFGPLSWREWGTTTYKHCDHHLKQFGA